MPRRKARVARRGPDPDEAIEQVAEITDPAAGPQPTTVVVEAVATGVLPEAVIATAPVDEIPGIESEKMRVGDPDVSPLSNEYSGEEVPGASTPTPDQNDVDGIGRAYGVEEEDTGSLRTSSELLDRRDRHRQD